MGVGSRIRETRTARGRPGMDTIRSILVGIDFTEGSRAALAQAHRLSDGLRAAVHAVHLLEPLVVSDLEAALSQSHGDVRAGLVADANEAWKEFAGDMGGSMSFETHIGHPVEGMAAAIARHKADLLVLGAHGSTPERAGAGTTATACVRRCGIKTLLVQDGKLEPFGRVLACTDFSDTSLEALAQASRIAVIEGAALHVAHAFAPPWERLHYRSPTAQASPDFRKQFRDGLERRLRAVWQEAAGAHRPESVEFHLLDKASHGAAITQLAHEMRADLIVLGTRGRTNLRDLLLGSTAERILRNAPCSILTINAR